MHVCFICICFKKLQQGNDTDVNRIYLSNYRFTASTSYCEAHSHLVATPWLPSLIIKTSTPTISQNSTQVFISADCPLTFPLLPCCANVPTLSGNRSDLSHYLLVTARRPFSLSFLLLFHFLLLLPSSSYSSTFTFQTLLSSGNSSSFSLSSSSSSLPKIKESINRGSKG